MIRIVAAKLKYHRLKPVVSESDLSFVLDEKLMYHRLKPVVSSIDIELRLPRRTLLRQPIDHCNQKHIPASLKLLQ